MHSQDLQQKTKQKIIQWCNVHFVPVWDRLSAWCGCGKLFWGFFPVNNGLTHKTATHNTHTAIINAMKPKSPTPQHMFIPPQHCGDVVKGSSLICMCIYVYRPAGLVGGDVADALSSGSDEGSRKLVDGCFLSTWPCPSSSKPDTTPCCLLCLLLSNRSFPKNASWTWHNTQHGSFLCIDTVHQEMSTCFLNISLETCLKRHSALSGIGSYSDTQKGPMRIDQSDREEHRDEHACCCHPHRPPHPPTMCYLQAVYPLQSRHVTKAPRCAGTLKA